MQKLAVKTLAGTAVFKGPPNGGWAWIVALSAFVVYGSSFGIAKAQGIFFVDIKNEFSISNAAISWLPSIVISTISFSGLLGKLMLKWLDARQVIMTGGCLSCTGLVIISLSPHSSVVYFGAIFAGVGLGISAIISISQTSMYFSTWRPMAIGIALSGSTVLGTIIPYLNQYLLDEYGWRGAYLVLGGIALNTCVAAALIRPVSVISESSNLTSNDQKSFDAAQPCNSKLINTVRMTSNSVQDVSRTSFDKETKVKNNNSDSCLCFLKKYSLAFGFLFVHFLLGLSLVVPNIFIVPYTKELGFTVANSTLLLSFISVGDFFGRIGVGLAVSKFTVLNQNLHFGISAFILLLALVQFVAIYFTTFPALMMYVIAYGAFFGSTTTKYVSFVGQALNPNIVESGMAAFYASSGLGYLVSLPIAGAVVDNFGSYHVVFWYTMISLLVAWSTCFLFSILVHRRGKLI